MHNGVERPDARSEGWRRAIRALWWIAIHALRIVTKQTNFASAIPTDAFATGGFRATLCLRDSPAQAQHAGASPQPGKMPRLVGRRFPDSPQQRRSIRRR